MIEEIADSCELKGSLSSILERYRHEFHPVMSWPEQEHELVLLDFTVANLSLANQNLVDTALFDEYVNSLLAEKQARMGAGGYLENRVIYRRSAVFESSEARSVHLGVDLWAAAFSPVFAPLPAKVHSFRDNFAFGDYGPTIILEHELEGQRFYTLYGHLSQRSLQGMEVGKLIGKGEAFCELGPFPENGDWPPHLHFQVISDLEGRQGDFPGVAAPSMVEKYRQICPNPNLVLNLPQLAAS